MIAIDKLSTGEDSDGGAAKRPVGACPAYGCGPLSVIEADGAPTRLRCVRCGWGGNLQHAVG